MRPRFHSKASEFLAPFLQKEHSEGTRGHAWPSHLQEKPFSAQPGPCLFEALTQNDPPLHGTNIKLNESE